MRDKVQASIRQRGYSPINFGNSVGKKKTRMVAAFDVETFKEGDLLVPYCVSFVYENKEVSFFGLNCINEFIFFLIKFINLNKKNKKKSKIYIYSHNLTFDGSLLLQHTKIKDVKYDGLLVNGSIYSLKIQIEKNFACFKCSYKLFPTKLSDAHVLLKTSKKTEIHHDNINISNFKKYEKEVVRYCINDSKIVLQIIKVYDMVIRNYLNRWVDSVYSMPGASVQIFKNFNYNGLDIEADLETDKMLRPAYYGGRCEVLGNPKKEEQIYHFDFKGMYAQVMLEKFCFNKPKLNFSGIFEKPGFYHISFLSYTDIPVLPVKDEITNKLLFKNGINQGLYWWEEIKLMAEEKIGKIININYSITFEKHDFVFDKFSKIFTEKRKEGTAQNNICKLIINSMYGRMGMRAITDKTEIFTKEEYGDFASINESKIIKETIINNIYIVQYEIEEKEKINSNVYIAATITSKARIKLYKGFLSTRKAGGRVLYCDTDSIFAAFKENVDNMTFGDVFFDMNKDDTRIKKALFAQAKAYAIVNKKEIVKIKGIRRNALSFKEFEQIFKNKEEKIVTFNSLEKSNYIITPKKIDKKVILHNYDKRTFTEDKTETTALVSRKVQYVRDASFEEFLKNKKIITKESYYSIYSFNKKIKESGVNEILITYKKNDAYMTFDVKNSIRAVELIKYANINNITVEGKIFNSREESYSFLINKKKNIINLKLKEGGELFNNINIKTFLQHNDT